MPVVSSLLGVDQVARLLGLSTRTIWRMVAEEKTPKPIRIGRLVRFHASEIDHWVRQGCPDRNAAESLDEGEIVDV